MKTNSRLAAIFGHLLAVPLLVFISGSATAQSIGSTSKPLSTEAPQRAATRSTAYAAFKSGNSTAALGALNSLVKHGSHAPHPDLQLAHELAGLAYRMQGDNEIGGASHAAELALKGLDDPQNRMTAKDAASAYLIAGDLVGYVLGDRSNAILAYQHALALNPELTHAKERLAHLSAIEENAKTKAAGNAVLRQRAHAR